MKGVYLKKGNTRVSVVPYYRIGDLFLTTIATNPSNFLGGTWQLYGPGRCLVCVNTSDSDFNTVKKTGGSKNHRHDFKVGFYRYYGAFVGDNFDNYSGAYSYSQNKYSKVAGIDSIRRGTLRNNVLGSGAINYDESVITSIGDTDLSSSLQPYITCYIWIRTA